MKTKNNTRIARSLMELGGLSDESSSETAGCDALLIPRDLALGEDGDEVCLTWQSLEEVDVTRSASSSILWDFIAIKDSSPDEVINFAKSKGVFLPGDPPEHFLQELPGAIPLALYCGHAAFIEDVLVLIAKTAMEEVIEESLLGTFVDFEPVGSLDQIGIAEGTVDYFQEEKRVEKEQWEKLISERSAGMGVQQQRRIVTSVMEGLLPTQRNHFKWDDRGRSLEVRSVGLYEVVASRVVEIFTSESQDVFVCSVCGSPFPFDGEGTRRRPRRGISRFCSDDCRTNRKRETRRLSWGRNGARWSRLRKMHAQGGTRDS